MNAFIVVKNRTAMFAGNVESGNIYSNFWSGSGTILFDNGETQTGSFINSRLNGKGCITSRHGTWNGNFVDGKLHGDGTITVYNPLREYSGTYRNGRLHGIATIVFQDGSDFIGSFIDGIPDLVGLYWYPDGSLRLDRY